MKPIAIALAAAVLLSLVGVGIYLWCRPQRREIRSFWDVVRNPDLMPSSDDREDAVAALSGSPEKITQFVDRYVFDAKPKLESESELQILWELGDEAYPRAIEILRDKSMHERLGQQEKHQKASDEAPINRLCEIFDQPPPPPREVAALLQPFQKSDNCEIRKSVALIIGSLGSRESLPQLREVLSDSDEDVREYALFGIQRAMKVERIAEAEKEEFFGVVAGLWQGDSGVTRSDCIPQILLQLNRERATQFLLRDEFLTIDFAGLHDNLSALSGHSIAVPRPRLHTIIAAANQEPLKYPKEYIVEYALKLLGSYRDAEDLPLLERFLDHKSDEISEGAIVGLYNYHDYYDRIRNPWDVEEQEGWQAMMEVEKYICALGQLNAEVNNGGFAQYYFNSSSEHWQDALNGLKAIGATKRHQTMLDTLARFPNASPAADRNTRMKQLAQITRQQENPFADQDAAWYSNKEENLDRLLFKYNLAHLEGREKT